MSIDNSSVPMLLATVVIGLCGAVFSTHAAEVALARLDCGSEPEPVSVASFSDAMAHPQLKLPLTYSCYLVRHGDRYLL